MSPITKPAPTRSSHRPSGERRGSQRGAGRRAVSTTGPAGARVLLLIPAQPYRATDFPAAARRMGLTVVVGSDGALPHCRPSSSAVADVTPDVRARARHRRPARAVTRAARLRTGSPALPAGACAAGTPWLPLAPPPAMAGHDVIPDDDPGRFRIRAGGHRRRGPFLCAAPARTARAHRPPSTRHGDPPDRHRPGRAAGSGRLVSPDRSPLPGSRWREPGLPPGVRAPGTRITPPSRRGITMAAGLSVPQRRHRRGAAPHRGLRIAAIRRCQRGRRGAGHRRGRGRAGGGPWTCKQAKQVFE